MPDSEIDLFDEFAVELTADGTPTAPMVVVSLDAFGTETPDRIARTIERMNQALPLVIGVLRGPVTPGLAPLLEAATLTVATDATASSLPQAVVVDGVDAALDLLRAAVRRSPRAAVACGQLLRQTVRLPTVPALAAEAAVYSMLLGGTEFERWLVERGAPRTVEPPSHPLVRTSRDDERLTITLDHPQRRNALSMRLREELLEAVRLADLDPTLTTVEINGAGPVFSSGGDLDEFGTATDLVAAYLVRLDRAPWRIIDRIRERVTVRAHGACIGAGAEVAAFAGTVIAAPDTYFAFPEVRMGLVPGAGGTVSVPRRIGRWRAAWLMLTEQRLAAAAALEWGMVDAVERTRR
ncbi:enoyl-CoA hydratase/isomerase family protein [Nocardia sp. NPDC049737]|uniref:enoyl-CoA hydratase/isomerase family protein n=1 Tax=Nocardia sp. NPDC049737 TaxID=3154358 RepID=UPI0034464DB3